MNELSRRKFLTGMASLLVVSGCASSSASRKSKPLNPSLPSIDLTDYAQFENSRKYATTPYGQIAYVAAGSGTPAIFLHGLGLNSYYWTHQLQDLSQSRRCLAIDLMAHGHTQIHPDQEVTFSAQAKMVLAFADSMGILKFDLVGSDSGGAIAQLTAAMAPDRVQSLILTNCDVHNNWPPQAFKQLTAQGGLAEQFKFIAENPALMRVPGGLASQIFEHPELITDEMTQIFLGPLTTTAHKRDAFNRYVAPQDTSQLTRIENDLKKLTLPALILWATNDHFFPLEWAYWLERTLPNAKPVVEFDGAKLFFPFERHQETNAQIRAFWAEI